MWEQIHESMHTKCFSSENVFKLPPGQFHSLYVINKRKTAFKKASGNQNQPYCLLLFKCCTVKLVSKIKILSTLVRLVSLLSSLVT